MIHSLTIQDPSKVSIKTIQRVLRGDIRQLALGDSVYYQVSKCYDYLQDRIASSSELHYGINTGFGSLCNVAIPPADIRQLQYNLVVSHACGSGDAVPLPLVRLMHFLKILNLSHGYSGVSTDLLDQLVRLYNADIFGKVYELGSLGASGDLAPLAHLALPLLGVGHVYQDGQELSAAAALQQAELSPYALQAKEGLALLNGTQFSAAYSAYVLSHGIELLRYANHIAAMSIEAFQCDTAPFLSYSHVIRGHRTQESIATDILEIIKDSPLLKQDRQSVQDPYSFRCIPQVHGASLTALEHGMEVLLREIHAVTDNPNIFPDENMIISAGNFHAQPLALVLDYVALALAEIGSISERRIYKLINGERGLPPYLSSNPGLESGYMIVQYTAASIVSQNKQLCTPASVDSIVSSMGQEDHVSMAANAATKAYRIIQNLYRLLSMEWLVAARALDCRQPVKASTHSAAMHTTLRSELEEIDKDHYLHDDMEIAEKVLRDRVMAALG